MVLSGLVDMTILFILQFFFPIRSAMDVYVHLFLFRWSETGDYFAVDQARFLNSLDVVKHFQTIKFSSFIRQLNMYGFRKFYPNNHKQGGCTCECHRTSPFGYYRHDFFRRGDIDCLNQITRQRRQSGVVTNGNVVFFQLSYETILNKFIFRIPTPTYR